MNEIQKFIAQAKRNKLTLRNLANAYDALWQGRRMAEKTSKASNFLSNHCGNGETNWFRDNFEQIQIDWNK